MTVHEGDNVQAGELKAGDHITAKVSGHFGKPGNLAGLHVFLRRHGPPTQDHRPDTIVLNTMGPIAMYPPGFADLNPPVTIEISGVVPSAIVGGDYLAEYAIVYLKDRPHSVTVIGIDPHRTFSRRILDDSSPAPATPAITSIT